MKPAGIINKMDAVLFKPVIMKINSLRPKSDMKMIDFADRFSIFPNLGREDLKIAIIMPLVLLYMIGLFVFSYTENAALSRSWVAEKK